MENNESFRFTYSAAQQQEVKDIRKKYLPPEEDKLALLHQLDEGCTRKATVLALILGILGTLILGVGMCCTMVWGDVWFIPGIGIGILGIVIVCLAYPVYSRTLEKERQRVAPQILALSEELLQ